MGFSTYLPLIDLWSAHTCIFYLGKQQLCLYFLKPSLIVSGWNVSFLFKTRWVVIYEGWILIGSCKRFKEQIETWLMCLPIPFILMYLWCAQAYILYLFPPQIGAQTVYLLLMKPPPVVFGWDLYFSVSKQGSFSASLVFFE